MLNDLYKQRQELQRQLTIVDSQIVKEEKKQEQRKQEHIRHCHKKSFIKDIKMFNDVSINIKFGTTLKTPHYKIEFVQDGDWWKAGINDLHKHEFINWVRFLKSEITIVRQSLEDLCEFITDYETDDNYRNEE